MEFIWALWFNSHPCGEFLSHACWIYHRSSQQHFTGSGRSRVSVSQVRSEFDDILRVSIFSQVTKKYIIKKLTFGCERCSKSSAGQWLSTKWPREKPWHVTHGFSLLLSFPSPSLLPSPSSSRSPVLLTACPLQLEWLPLTLCPGIKHTCLTMCPQCTPLNDPSYLVFPHPPLLACLCSQHFAPPYGSNGTLAPCDNWTHGLGIMPR